LSPLVRTALSWVVTPEFSRLQVAVAGAFKSRQRTMTPSS
jgi:hypothetical protein